MSNRRCFSKFNEQLNMWQFVNCVMWRHMCIPSVTLLNRFEKDVMSVSNVLINFVAKTWRHKLQWLIEDTDASSVNIETINSCIWNGNWNFCLVLNSKNAFFHTFHWIYNFNQLFSNTFYQLFKGLELKSQIVRLILAPLTSTLIWILSHSSC